MPKIILTRFATSCEKLMLNTIHALQSSYINLFLLLFVDNNTKNLSHVVETVDLIIEFYLRRNMPLSGFGAFKKNDKMVKQSLLRGIENFWSSDWELGKPVPSHAFPRVNDSNSWRKAFRPDWYG